MGMLDGLLAQLGPNLDIASLASKVGLSPEQAEMAVKALGMAHPEPGDTVAAAASNTGLSPDVLQQVMGMMGGEGALGTIAGMLGGAAGGAAGGAGGMLGQVGGMLDRDGDGNPINDIAGIAGGLFGGKK